MSLSSIPSRLFGQAQTRPNAPAYYVRGPKEWQPSSWATYASNVRQVGRALLASGVESGNVICILGNNRPEWCEMDVGAMAVGAIPAGIYQTCSSEEIAYILNHSEAPIILVENKSQWAKVNAVRSELPHLKTIVLMNGCEPVDDESAMGWSDFLKTGEATEPKDVDDAVKNLDPDGPATCSYT